MLSASSLSAAALRLSSSIELMTFSNSISPCLICSDALSITDSEIPSFFDISKAFDFPGTPIKSLYVGVSVSTSNSIAAFSTPLVARAYFFSSL